MDRRSPHPRPSPLRAFTLIELLVVIAIIGILSAVALTVSSKVSQGGKSRLTESVIKVLDEAVTAYTAQKEGAVPSYYTDAAGNTFPLVDGRYDGRQFPIRDLSPMPPTAQHKYDRDLDPSQPTTTLFLLLAADVPAVDAMLKGLDNKLIERRPVNAWGWQATDQTIKQWDEAPGDPQPLTGIVIKDGFGNPIRMVHPAFDGGYGDFYNGASLTGGRPILQIKPPVRGVSLTTEARFSRSYRPFDGTAAPNPTGDADEGICPGNNPYFYSAGVDGDPGTRDDNVYSTKPTYPPETSKFLN